MEKTELYVLKSGFSGGFFSWMKPEDIDDFLESLGVTILYDGPTGRRVVYIRGKDPMLDFDAENGLDCEQVDSIYDLR